VDPSTGPEAGERTYNQGMGSMSHVGLPHSFVSPRQR
jgi:hypothetical protein